VNASHFGFLADAKPAKWLAKPKCQAWACDATKIHAHARNKPFCAGASLFCEPKSELSDIDTVFKVNGK
jgi:hypothetical protein